MARLQKPPDAPMPKGIVTDPQIRANATMKAIAALRDGIPANVIAMTYGLKGRTLHRWLQRDPQAYRARLEAIYSGRRFARGLSEKQLLFRKQQALRRLLPNKSEAAQIRAERIRRE